MENLIPVDLVAPQPDAPVAPQAEDDNQSAIVRPLTPEGSRTAESDTAAPTTREGGAGAPEGVAPLLDSAGVVGAAATATATGGLVGDVVPHVDAAVVGAVAHAGEDNGGWAWDASTQAWVPALAGGSGAPLALVDYDTTAAAIHAEDGSVAQPAADAATAVERFDTVTGTSARRLSIMSLERPEDHPPETLDGAVDFAALDPDMLKRVREWVELFGDFSPYLTLGLEERRAEAAAGGARVSTSEVKIAWRRLMKQKPQDASAVQKLKAVRITKAFILLREDDMRWFVDANLHLVSNMVAHERFAAGAHGHTGMLERLQGAADEDERASVSAEIGRLFGEEDKLDQALLLTATDDTLRLFERPVYDRREDWFPCAAPGLVFRGIPVLITFNRRGIALRYLTQIYAQCIMCVVICSWVRTRLSSVIVPMLLELMFITGGLEAVYRVIHSWEERFDWSLVLKWRQRWLLGQFVFGLLTLNNAVIENLPAIGLYYIVSFELLMPLVLLAVTEYRLRRIKVIPPTQDINLIAADDTLLHAAAPLVVVALISPLLLASGAFAAARDIWRRRARLAAEAEARLVARATQRERMIARLVRGEEEEEEDGGGGGGDAAVGVNQQMKSAAEVLAETRAAAAELFEECFANAFGRVARPALAICTAYLDKVREVHARTEKFAYNAYSCDRAVQRYEVVRFKAYTFFYLYELQWRHMQKKAKAPMWRQRLRYALNTFAACSSSAEARYYDAQTEADADLVEGYSDDDSEEVRERRQREAVGCGGRVRLTLMRLDNILFGTPMRFTAAVHPTKLAPKLGGKSADEYLDPPVEEVVEDSTWEGEASKKYVVSEKRNEHAMRGFYNFG